MIILFDKRKWLIIHTLYITNASLIYVLKILKCYIGGQIVKNAFSFFLIGNDPYVNFVIVTVVSILAYFQK